MKQFLIVLFCLLPLSVFSQKTVDDLLSQYNTRSVPYISVEELRMLQKNGDVIILDTREEEEFSISHIATAKHIGFNTFSAEKISSKIADKDTPIIVYCSLGIRSEEIAEKLKKAGYNNIKNLYGGIFEWKNKGYPVLNTLGKETDSIHTFSKAWSKWLKKGVSVHSLKRNNKNE